ncbi:hypothetical protein HDV06_006993 [Boothiomyces sp. JEL0866]|nr:hypothetical protein HDV06_006993 [Boothiomyces sp. JEL0866]
MSIAAFGFRALQANLKSGNGIQKFPPIKQIKIVFGKDTCKLLGPTSSFYVNELPRIYDNNREIKFVTEHGEQCKLEIQGSETVDLAINDCRTTSQIYNKLVEASVSSLAVPKKRKRLNVKDELLDYLEITKLSWEVDILYWWSKIEKIIPNYLK